MAPNNLLFAIDMAIFIGQNIQNKNRSHSVVYVFLAPIHFSNITKVKKMAPSSAVIVLISPNIMPA